MNGLGGEVIARLRPVAYLIQPQFVLDDGQNLAPWQPMLGPDGRPQRVMLTIAASDWANVVEIVAGAVEQLSQQVASGGMDGNHSDAYPPS